MSILVNRETRLLVQGITGREGSFHTTQMVAYGTNVVSGVTPGGKGKNVAGVFLDSVTHGKHGHHRPDPHDHAEGGKECAERIDSQRLKSYADRGGAISGHVASLSDA